MKTAVVVGSTRRGRLGDRVCRFVLRKAADVDGAEFPVVDLADHPLPFFDEPVAPLSSADRAPSPAVRAWLTAVAAADGYLILTPEYNHAPPAVLKNAFDFLATEAAGKPASILSYSSTAHGGTVAGQLLRLTLSKVGMLPLPASLPLAHADRLLSSTGELVEDSAWARRVDAFVPAALRDLVSHAAALTTLRADRAITA